MMESLTYLRSINADYIDELYDHYLADPNSVDDTWRYFFDGIHLGAESMASRTLASPTSTGANNGHAAASASNVVALPQKNVDAFFEARAMQLVFAYRTYGRLLAKINPLADPPAQVPMLDLATYGLSNGDLARSTQMGKLLKVSGFEGETKLSDLIQALKDTYCRTTAHETEHLQNPEEKLWVQTKLEQARGTIKLDADTKKFIHHRLARTEGFEKFLHTRYVAQKRFSVEGGDGVMPLLDCFIEEGAELGVSDVVIGMAHRGRLNVLTNLFDKKPEYIFTEFEGTYTIDTSIGEGDVKYHMGYSCDHATRKGKNVHLSLGSNPSHLEFINPVIEGITRAKQEYLGDKDRTRVVPIQIHGDAAFAGQGVCFETLNLSQLEGYKTGGSLHVVINNQVGFTTSPKDSRSTFYCTDLAKMLDCPIIHVNGDDAEAVWAAGKLAIEYRQKFKKDVVIDLVCYRRHGHNEGDEPAFTQPLLYKRIKTHPTPREVYAARLAQEGVLSAEQAQAVVDAVTESLTKAQAVAKADAPHPAVSVFKARWEKLRRPDEDDHFKPVKTAVAEGALKELSAKLNTIPSTFHLHSKLARFFEARAKAVADGKGIDWGNAETLAYGSLVSEGFGVRLSGQDAERGTFTHRHAVLNDFENAQTYTPLNNLGGKQARFQVHNSHLSETGVMGFEYGYSLADPSVLTIWEAQFGDFANGAQVIIDQFLASGESKWQRMSGLTLLLPHGFEGQGPEHSSARLERFLQLCAKNNMIVGNFTTPAQIFHALRRQVKRDFRKPLVVMSPKSLLRHPMAQSELWELTDAGLNEVLDDALFFDRRTGKSTAAAKGVKKVLLCTGKVAYDLMAARTERKLEAEVAIVRVEQLYPWPARALVDILGRYGAAKLTWVQEEPRNMGAWGFIHGLWSGATGNFSEAVGNRALHYAGRELCAAPACGSPKLHEKEQKALIEKAFTE